MAAKKMILHVGHQTTQARNRIINNKTISAFVSLQEFMATFKSLLLLIFDLKVKQFICRYLPVFAISGGICHSTLQ